MTTKSDRASGSTSALFMEIGLLIKSRVQKAVPLPFSQYQALSFVAERSRVSMQEVARHFKIRAPSATFLVEELARGGLVARHANKDDRRRVEVTLTAKGKKIFKSVQKKRDNILRELFSSLQRSDRQELNRILVKIINKKI
jgi:DNA-binding MarR family transcriptional regulator